MAASGSAGRGTILLAEDDGLLRGLARSVLQRAGYRVLEAGSGEEALEVSQRHGEAMDLLLTDMVMTGALDGNALADRLQLERPGIRVLCMSGYSTEIGSSSYPLIYKPFTPSELLTAVRDVLTKA